MFLTIAVGGLYLVMDLCLISRLDVLVTTGSASRSNVVLLGFDIVKVSIYTGDGDVISIPAGFHRHLVGKTLIHVFHRDITETRFVGKLMIIRTFS